MFITLPKGASPRAISVASKIEIISVTSDIGVAAAIVAPVASFRDKLLLVRRAVVVMADKSGRLLSGHVENTFLPSPGFSLTLAVVHHLAQLRKWSSDPNSSRQYHASGTLNICEAEGQTAKGLPSVIADLLTLSLKATSGKPHTTPEQESFSDDFDMLASAIIVEWRRVAGVVIKALSPVENAAVVATRNCVMFNWSGYSACAEDSESGRLSREFVTRNQALGCLFLSIPEVKEMVASGVDDRTVLKEACRGNVFERGKHNEAARMARIGLDALRWEPSMLRSLVNLGLPLDWLPGDTGLANDTGLAHAVANSMELIAGSGRPFSGLDPFAGCGGDWRDFVVRMFDASGLKESSPHSWSSLTELALSGRDMTWDARMDLVVPALAVYGGDEELAMMSALADVNWNSASTLSFTRWLLFHGCSVVASLKRSQTYIKGARRRREALVAHPGRGLQTFVWTENMTGFVRQVDGIWAAILGIARVGSEAERIFIEEYHPHNDKWQRRGCDIVKLPANEGDTESLALFMATVRVPASTPEGYVCVLTGVGYGDKVPSYDRVVEAICGGERGLLGDVLLNMADVSNKFIEPLPPHLDALMPGPRPRPNSDRALRTHAPRLGVSYREPTVASVDASFAAWKNALPRRLRVGSASDFAAVVMKDLRAYLALDGVKNVIASADPRLETRKRIMDRMASGMNSVEAARCEDFDDLDS